MPKPVEGTAAVIDEVVTGWPEVQGKNVFGHRGWIRRGKMIGFVADDGVAVKALSGEHASELYARDGAHPFFYNGTMEMRGWPVLRVDEGDVDAVLSELKRVYDGV